MKAAIQILIGLAEMLSKDEFWQSIFEIIQHRQARKDTRFLELTGVRSIRDLVDLEKATQQLNKQKYITVKKADRLQRKADKRGLEIDPQEEEETMNRQILYIVIHCTATPDGREVTADEVRGWHMNDRGWSDIGYHFFIRRDGTLELGRDLDKDGFVLEEVGAHVKGYNLNSIAICWAGGAAGIDDRTPQQHRTLESLVKLLHEVFPAAQIMGHRDFPGVKKDCPSFDVEAWLKQINITL